MERFAYMACGGLETTNFRKALHFNWKTNVE